MNRITVIGRMASDVEVKDFNGRNVANFSVAAQNKNKDKQTGQYGTNFYRVSAWGATADIATKYLRKGHRVGVSGDLVIRNYVGSDQVKYTAVEINNAEIDLIETRAESEAKAQAVSAATIVNTAQAPVYQQAPAQTYTQNPGFTPVETDELPF